MPSLACNRNSQPCSLGGSSDAVSGYQYFSNLLCHPVVRYGGIKRYRDPSVRLSVPWRSCLGYRHAGCLQLSYRRLPEMCGLRTRPRTDVDPPRFLPPSNCRRRGGAYRLAASRAIPRSAFVVNKFIGVGVLKIRSGGRCVRAKFHYTDPTRTRPDPHGPARTFFAAKLRWVRAGRRQSPCGSV